MKRSVLLLFLIATTLFQLSAQWSVDSLNTPGSGLICGSTSTKAVFTNGTEWNVYDVNLGTHIFGNLAIARAMIDVAQLNEKVYFGGGKYGYFADPLYTKTVDVYNAATNSWSTLNLSKAREVGGAGALGNKVVFAGGSGRDFGGPVYLYNKVDIFDATTGARTTAKLSKARSNIAVGAAVDKIVFAGGWYWDMMYNVLQANTVDIYNVSTGTWTKTTLSKKRENIAVAVIGSKIIFAGGSGGTYGGALKNVDIYDAATNTWTTSMMPTAMYGMQSAVAGNKAYFAGGYGGLVNQVTVFDVTTGLWSTMYMPTSLSNFSISAINGRIYFAGGLDAPTSTYSNLVQVFDPVANTWSNEYLSQARASLTTCVVNGFGVFAGGIKMPYYPTTYSNRVDIFDAPLRLSPQTDLTVSPTLDLLLFPNPVSTQLQLNINDPKLLPLACIIYDRSGRIVHQFTMDNETMPIDLSGLATGTYILIANNNEQQHVVKTFIKN